ncbi:MAG TPA: hypothetical protein VNT54_13925, partial [Solirubrobacteraceae bacterium]|nr:hypothetical protein [Solirubrobacteraceae bacterium]
VSTTLTPTAADTTSQPAIPRDRQHAARGSARARLRHHGVVPFVAPMLLATAPDWPDPHAWALEPKRDGYRMVDA